MRKPRFVASLLAVLIAGMTFSKASDAIADPELAPAIARGQALYFANCSLCHGATGDGITGVYPPLARSDWLAAHRSGAIRAVVNGLKEEIPVNGQTYQGQMPPAMLSDAEVADTLTFVVNS